MTTHRGQTPLTLSEPRGRLPISDGGAPENGMGSKFSSREVVTRRDELADPGHQSRGREETAVWEAPPFECRSCLEVWGRQRKPVQTLGFLTFSHVRGPLLARLC